MSQINAKSLSSGVEIKTENLVGLRHIANLLPLHKQKKVLNELSGVHTSNLRGRGVDFSEVRSYQPGDDIRSMDWRVTARNQKPHIKVFREERERPIMIVCDLRSNMFFGTQHAFKSVLAADLASLFTWAAANNGDRIGTIFFDNEKEIDIRPKPGRKQVMRIIHELSKFTSQQAPIISADTAVSPHNRLSSICRHARRVIRPGSTVYFISDWHSFDQDCEHQLYQMNKHNDVIALNIFDAFEQNTLPVGSYPLTNGEQKIQLECTSQSQGLERQQAFLLRQQNLKNRMLKLGMPLINLQAQDDIISLLRHGLGLSQNITKKGRR